MTQREQPDRAGLLSQLADLMSRIDTERIEQEEINDHLAATSICTGTCNGLADRMETLPCGCQDVYYVDGTVCFEHNHVRCGGQLVVEALANHDKRTDLYPELAGFRKMRAEYTRDRLADPAVTEGGER